MRTSDDLLIADAWERIGADPDLANARQKLSMHEIRRIVRHTMDALEIPRPPSDKGVPLSAKAVPYSSVVGGGLTLTAFDGSAAFIVNFMGTSKGITKEETASLATQFLWFVKNFGLVIPPRPQEPRP